MPALLVIASFPDIEIARHIGTSLIEKQLAACVNLHPSTESIYRWQGKVESATEVLALIKTSAERYPSLEAEIHSLHPYDVPEIIAIDIGDYRPFTRADEKGVSSDAIKGAHGTIDAAHECFVGFFKELFRGFHLHVCRSFLC